MSLRSLCFTLVMVLGTTAFAADKKKPAPVEKPVVDTGTLTLPPMPDLDGDRPPGTPPPSNKPPQAKPAEPAKQPDLRLPASDLPAPGAKPVKAKPTLDISRMPFDAKAIQDVVKFHMPDIQECYEQALADSGKKIEGRVMVGFIIDPNGNVSAAKALPKKSTMKEARIVDCVTDNVRLWPFPKPGDNRDHPIEFPFDLKVIK